MVGDVNSSKSNLTHNFSRQDAEMIRARTSSKYDKVFSQHSHFVERYQHMSGWLYLLKESPGG